MSNRETTFENAKVKDLVFCSLAGNQLLETNGQIIGITEGVGQVAKNFRGNISL